MLMRLPDFGKFERFAIANSLEYTSNVYDSTGLGMTGLAVARGPKRGSDDYRCILRQVYDVSDQLPLQMQAALDALASRLAERNEQPAAATDNAEQMLMDPTNFAFV